MANLVQPCRAPIPGSIAGRFPTGGGAAHGRRPAHQGGDMFDLSEFMMIVVCVGLFPCMWPSHNCVQSEIVFSW